MFFPSSSSGVSAGERGVGLCPSGVPAHVSYGAKKLRTRLLAGLRMCGLTSVLRTRPPVEKQREQIGRAHDAVAVEVRRPAGVGAP